MESMRLQLEFPSSHDLYTNFKGDSLSQPIPASVIISTPHLNQSYRIRVRLIQRLSKKGKSTTDGSEHILSRVYQQLLLPRPRPIESYSTQSCSVIEDLSLPVSSSRDDQAKDLLKIPFYMPILANIPGTSTTDIGKISYLLVASITTEDDKFIGTSKEIVLRRRTLLEQDSIQHTRNYPHSNVITKILLSQNSVGLTGFNFSIAAKLFLRQPATPALRSTEFRCVAIRGLRWRVEEVAKLYRRPRHQTPPEIEPIEEHSSTRELSNGIQKGYWGTMHNPLLANDQIIQQKDSSVDVSFEVTIPNTVTPAPEVNFSSYEFESLSTGSLPLSLQEEFAFSTKDKMLLTTEHQLKLDVLVSEDIFDASSRKLVDRTPLRTALCASFPLRIVDRAEPHIDEMVFTGTPPLYQEIPDSPPNYESFPPSP